MNEQGLDDIKALENNVMNSLAQCEKTTLLYHKYHEQFENTWDDNEKQISLSIFGSLTLIAQEMVKMLNYCEHYASDNQESDIDFKVLAQQLKDDNGLSEFHLIKHYLEFADSFTQPILNSIESFVQL
jgi:hypothetical protein